MRFGAVMVSLSMAVLCAAPLPRLEKKDGKYRFVVDDQPFLVLGAQLHNSSTWTSELDHIWPQLAQLGVNTVEAPIYWQQVEPRPGEFHFDELDALVNGARSRNLRVVLLWFGTWKNASMDYVPDWVKTDTARFPRVLDRDGQPTTLLAPTSRNAMEADSKAFRAVMAHLRQIDEEARTVILVQVENESGMLHTDRDYSETANQLFHGPVPAALASALHKKPGSWREVFGTHAEEAFSTWYVASYVNEVAGAGKQAYPLPMYVNAWLSAGRRPGEYPSGGPGAGVLDIWKAAAPNIDILAPDIYIRDYMGYRRTCESYKRPDNPLFIPETGGSTPFARYMFYALGDYDAIGFAPFGIDVKGEKLNPQWSAMAANYHLLRPALPLIMELQGTGRLKGVSAEEFVSGENLAFRGYDLEVTFGAFGFGGLFGPRPEPAAERAGRALVAQTGDGEFYLMGFDCRFSIRPSLGAAKPRAQLLTVEEGTFENGVWKARRLLNGDEVNVNRITLPPDGRILKVRVMSF